MIGTIKYVSTTIVEIKDDYWFSKILICGKIKGSHLILFIYIMDFNQDSFNFNEFLLI